MEMGASTARRLRRQVWLGDDIVFTCLYMVLTYFKMPRLFGRTF